MHKASRPAGYLLSALSLVPALLVTGWLIVAVPLVVVGQFRPATVAPLAAIACVVLVPLGLALLRHPAAHIRTPWWPVILTVLIGVGFAVFAAVTHSENIILRRDPGAYAQMGYWYAFHPTWSIPAPLSAFGPNPGQLGFGSLGFNQVDNTIVGQFMTGWPTMLAAGYWVSGWSGLLILPAIIGGCAIVAVGGLVARLMGAKWAPLGALFTAFTWPVLWASQTTLSEPVAMLLLASAICLAIDWLVVTADPVTDPRLRHRVWLHAFAAGLVLGAGELVRLDIGVDAALMLPALGWLWVRRRPGVWAYLIGLLLGGALGALDGLVATRPYIGINISSVRVLVALVVAAVLVTAVVAVVLRRLHRPVREQRWWRPVPAIGAALVGIIGVLLLIRPFVLIDHSTTDPNIRDYTGVLQQINSLPVDGTRGYAEQSLIWVSWYIGWPAAIAAFVAAAMLVWRTCNGRDKRWIPVLLVYAGSALLTLIHPGITPDHPFADRRLVVEMLPGMILLATWAMVEAFRWLRGVAARATGGWPRRWPRIAMAVLLLAYLVSMGIVTVPMSTKRTYIGEIAISDQVCRALPANASVVMSDTLWMPTIRAQCGLPATQLIQMTPDAVAQVTASIRAVGRTPVFVALDPGPLMDGGLVPQQVFHDVTMQDEQVLMQRPGNTSTLDLQFWMATP